MWRKKINKRRRSLKLTRKTIEFNDYYILITHITGTERRYVQDHKEDFKIVAKKCLKSSRCASEELTWIRVASPLLTPRHGTRGSASSWVTKKKPQKEGGKTGELSELAGCYSQWQHGATARRRTRLTGLRRGGCGQTSREDRSIPFSCPWLRCDGRKGSSSSSFVELCLGWKNSLGRRWGGAPGGCAQKSVIRWNEFNVQLTDVKSFSESLLVHPATGGRLSYCLINLSTARLSEGFQDAELWLLKTSFMETVLVGREAGPHG